MKPAPLFIAVVSGIGAIAGGMRLAAAHWLTWNQVATFLVTAFCCLLFTRAIRAARQPDG